MSIRIDQSPSWGLWNEVILPDHSLVYLCVFLIRIVLSLVRKIFTFHTIFIVVIKPEFIILTYQRVFLILFLKKSFFIVIKVYSWHCNLEVVNAAWKEPRFLVLRAHRLISSYAWFLAGKYHPEFVFNVISYLYYLILGQFYLCIFLFYVTSFGCKFTFRLLKEENNNFLEIPRNDTFYKYFVLCKWTFSLILLYFFYFTNEHSVWFYVFIFCTSHNYEHSLWYSYRF